MTEESVHDVIAMMDELSSDDSIPRNVRAKIGQMITVLKGNEALSIRFNKVLSELDEIADDTNVQSFTRTQIMSLSSMIESIDIDEE